jgi:N-acetylmuramoyl-L-alanine amidase
MNIKTLFLVCFLLTFFNISTLGQAKDKVGKIVIDAGHGGSMPGAVGKLSKEKDINLKVALRLGKLISDNFDDVKVIYTRKGDETVDLYKRAEIANKNKADLFISIHCNAAENKSAHGVETFVIGLGKSAESMAIAKKENADMLLEKDYKTNYSDFDPNSAEAYIVFSLYSSAYRNNSISFASKVQTHLVSNSGMTNRTVQEAGFWVLYKVAMPSILIELGFISNAEEERYLIREEVQELLTVSIYNAFVEYKNLIEGTLKPYLPIPKIAKQPPKPEISEITELNTIPDDSNISAPEVAPDSVSNPITPTTAPTENQIFFRIQFFSSKENLKTTDKKFSPLSEVKKYFENNVWKYTTGNYKTLLEAQEMLREVKKRYTDAFIIAFQNEQKISIQEALKLLE